MCEYTSCVPNQKHQSEENVRSTCIYLSFTSMITKTFIAFFGLIKKEKDANKIDKRIEE